MKYTNEHFSTQLTLPRLVEWFNAQSSEQRTINEGEMYLIRVKAIKNSDGLPEFSIQQIAPSNEPYDYLGETVFLWVGPRGTNLTATPDTFYEVSRQVAPVVGFKLYDLKFTTPLPSKPSVPTFPYYWGVQRWATQVTVVPVSDSNEVFLERDSADIKCLYRLMPYTTKYAGNDAMVSIEEDGDDGIVVRLEPLTDYHDFSPLEITVESTNGYFLSTHSCGYNTTHECWIHVLFYYNDNGKGMANVTLFKANGDVTQKQTIIENADFRGISTSDYQASRIMSSEDGVWHTGEVTNGCRDAFALFRVDPETADINWTLLPTLFGYGRLPFQFINGTETADGVSAITSVEHTGFGVSYLTSIWNGSEIEWSIDYQSEGGLLSDSSQSELYVSLDGSTAYAVQSGCTNVVTGITIDQESRSFGMGQSFTQNGWGSDVFTSHTGDVICFADSDQLEYEYDFLGNEVTVWHPYSSSEGILEKVRPIMLKGTPLARHDLDCAQAE